MPLYLHIIFLLPSYEIPALPRQGLEEMMIGKEVIIKVYTMAMYSSSRSLSCHLILCHLDRQIEHSLARLP